MIKYINYIKKYRFILQLYRNRLINISIFNNLYIGVIVYNTYKTSSILTNRACIDPILFVFSNTVIMPLLSLLVWPFFGCWPLVIRCINMKRVYLLYTDLCSLKETNTNDAKWYPPLNQRLPGWSYCCNHKSPDGLGFLQWLMNVAYLRLN